MRKLFLVAFAAILAACTRVERAPLPPGAPSHRLEIPANGQGNVGELSIGLGYIRSISPVVVSGASRSLEAGLWITVHNDLDQNKTVGAHAGDRIQAGNAEIFVEEVRGVGGKNASVRLAIYALPVAPKKSKGG